MSQSVQRKAFKSTDYTNAKKVSHGDLRDDRPPHGRFLASMPSRHSRVHSHQTGRSSIHGWT
ncbi:hypothetical protein CKQ84_02945 [Shewanella sp. WE21]|nr:hypothetical protein CKQ84_02945 [Shewanella sp. WE21]